MVDANIKTQFDDDGYVALPQFLSEQEVLHLNETLDDLISNRLNELPAEHVFYEDKSKSETLKQLQQVWRYDSALEELFRQGRFRKLAELLLDGPVVPKNLQWFNKPPQVGLGTPAHQDGFYFMLEPCEALTMWLALDEVDDENGCVRYVTGSHHDGMRSHGKSGRLGFSQSIIDFGRESDVSRENAMPASPGDLLAHHALTVHRADGNRSFHRSRRALGFIYYAERASEDASAHHAYQQQLQAELRASGRI